MSTQVNPSLCFVKVHHPSDAAVGYTQNLTVNHMVQYIRNGG